MIASHKSHVEKFVVALRFSDVSVCLLSLTSAIERNDNRNYKIKNCTLPFYAPGSPPAFCFGFYVFETFCKVSKFK